MISYNLSKKDVDELTLAQGKLLLRECQKIQRKRNADLAYTIVACAFDKDAWKKITEDL